MKLWPLAVALAAALFQPQAQQPTFRSSTNVVPLSVSVLDRRGQPVTDLTASDFTVFEDNTRRDLVAFFPLAQAPRVAVAGPAGRIERHLRQQFATPARRTFLLTLGFGRIQHPTNALDGALKFVKEHLNPEDAVAVMAFHRVTEFTTDHERIVQLLERFKREHERIHLEVREFRLRYRPRFGPPLPLPARIFADIDRSVFRDVAIRNTADLLLGMDRATPVAERPWQRQQTFQQLLKQLEQNKISLVDSVLIGGRLKLLAGIEYLRYLEGEKHVVFLASNPIAIDADDAQFVGARANDARVTVNYVFTDGTRMWGGQGCQPCRDVVEKTGGHYTSLDYADRALATVDAVSRSAYLLGFTPIAAVPDGRYRSVRVVVNRPDVDVKFRHGFYLETEIDPVQQKAAIVSTRMDAALAYDAAAADIAVNVTAEPTASDAGSDLMRVTVNVDVSALAFAEDARGVRGEIELQVHCGDRRQTVVGSHRERIELRPGVGALAEWKKAGYRHTVLVRTKGATAYVKAVVYDYEADRIGSGVIRLTPR